MEAILLTQQGGILKPFAWVLGKIFEVIYSLCSSLGIESIGLCIILFTIIVRLLMLPMQIKQQKSMKLNSVVTPEIQKIQKKYENRKDQQSQMAMQQEVSAVYEKYGASPAGGCLQLLIQMPIMFALYRVIMNIPAYVGQVKDYYVDIINNLSTAQIKEYFDISVSEVSSLTGEQINNIVDSMSGYRSGKLEVVDLAKLVEAVDNPAVDNAYEHIRNINNFFIYNLSDSPQQMWETIGALALIIPILAGVAQFVSTQISMKMNGTAQQMEDNPAMSSMKMMNYTMPLMSIFFCWGFATGIGLYWVTGSVVMVIQQIFINLYFKRISIDDIIKENQEKAKKKREKKGITENMISNAASVNTRTINSNSSMSSKEREAKLNEAMERYSNSSNQNKKSISSRANMVKEFNERNKK